MHNFMKKALIIIILVVLVLYLAAIGIMSTQGSAGDQTDADPAGGTGVQQEQPQDPADDINKQPQDPADDINKQPQENQDAEKSKEPEQPQETKITKPEPVEVKGIYATGITVGSSRLDELIELIDQTELNSLVVDIKDATGYLTTNLQLESELEVDSSGKKIKDLSVVLQKLKEHDIYTIARIVVFKDSLLVEQYPELAVKRVSGGVWYDYKGKAWTDPYNRKVWDYNTAVAEAAAEAGFDEIQFDYVRFPSDGPLKEAVYPGKDDKGKAETIAEFLAYAKNRLEKHGVFLSADVFGLTTSAKDDLGIGQKIELIAANTDYVSPMVYPSHYALGSYGIKNPNAAPYRTVHKSLTDAVYRLQETDNIIRPWLQDFSYGYPYGTDEVKAQVQATYDAGLKEWILWNPSNRYTEAALIKE